MQKKNKRLDLIVGINDWYASGKEMASVMNKEIAPPQMRKTVRLGVESTTNFEKWVWKGTGGSSTLWFSNLDQSRTSTMINDTISSWRKNVVKWRMRVHSFKEMTKVYFHLSCQRNSRAWEKSLFSSIHKFLRSSTCHFLIRAFIKNSLKRSMYHYFFSSVSPYKCITLAVGKKSVIPPSVQRILSPVARVDLHTAV